MTPEAWSRARNVLAVRLDGMGDLLMSTPALRALKESVPHRRLSLLVSPAGAAVARQLPFVDDVIVFRAPWMKHPEDADAATRTEALVRDLRARRFEAAVVLTVFSQSPLPAALVLLLAAVPLRAGYCRENPYTLLTHWLPERDLDVHRGVRHEVQRQLDLAAALGARASDTRLQFPVDAAARSRVIERLREAGVRAGTRLLVVHPGATAASRRYPLEALRAAMARLAAEDGWSIVVAGGPEDVASSASLCAAPVTAISLAGLLDIGELAALLQLASVVVSNNSVAAHLAAAVGTPVVDLYALTNPQHTPWSVPNRVLNHDVDCRYCFKSVCPQGHHRCLADVAPAEVVDAVRDLAAGAQSAAPAVAVAGARVTMAA